MGLQCMVNNVQPPQTVDHFDANASAKHRPKRSQARSRFLVRSSPTLCSGSAILTDWTVARVKKIIHADSEISNCSTNGAFLITVAAEMFLQHLVEQSYNIVKSERTSKPRRNIQYRDVANAVARVENLEFLTDVVPKTITYKQYKDKVAKKAIVESGGGSSQGTLDKHMEGVEHAAFSGQNGGNAGAHTAMEIDNVDGQDVDEDVVIMSSKNRIEGV
nr:putative transcription factor c16c4.22 [Quercus suber]